MQVWYVKYKHDMDPNSNINYRRKIPPLALTLKFIFGINPCNFIYFIIDHLVPFSPGISIVRCIICAIFLNVLLMVVFLNVLLMVVNEKKKSLKMQLHQILQKMTF